MNFEKRTKTQKEQPQKIGPKEIYKVPSKKKEAYKNKKDNFAAGGPIDI